MLKNSETWAAKILKRAVCIPAGLPAPLLHPHAQDYIPITGEEASWRAPETQVGLNTRWS